MKQLQILSLTAFLNWTTISVLRKRKPLKIPLRCNSMCLNIYIYLVRVRMVFHPQMEWIISPFTFEAFEYGRHVWWWNGIGLCWIRMCCYDHSYPRLSCHLLTAFVLLLIIAVLSYTPFPFYNEINKSVCSSLFSWIAHAHIHWEMILTWSHGGGD